MDLGSFVNKAKDLAEQGLGKAREVAGENSEKVTSGLEKAEEFVNEKTGGKYAEVVAKGKDGLESALGVAGDAKEALKEELQGEHKPEAVSVDPIAAPEGVEPPKPV
ncbi:antitoxin [Dermatophilus congolensis]|uniref:Antitoxin n=1 Tax=Dermatophilus congolensis TaxID=1863 RepID=A0A239VDV2_9MICO|nr:antitoxin [Dermatophilus congolensis]MBO3128544.1 antitoxin [Dermatophilus congolensis]MBO3132820.1 antitoxin [Dermatophilus congolensis]MBO3133021.1 antitoxin [Dermatophilus congolensis]MBO3135256.1 antitoxin [Dermatophilus congolensis]MBO3137495.1 antitoxin [Dermatophilus congolensis]